MENRHEQRPSLFDQFYARAAQPKLRIRDYLSFVLQSVLRSSGSDAGMLAPDFQMDEHDTGTSNPPIWLPTLQAAKVSETSAFKGFPGGRAIVDSMKLKTEDGKPAGLFMTGSSERSLGEDEAVKFIFEAQSSIWVQLGDGNRPLGWLALASHYPDAYPEALVEFIQGMLSHAACALNRLLLREYASKNGREINLIGISPSFLEFEHKLKNAAAHYRGAVLIRGERGSGKELAAYAIHYFSKRREGPFVPILASALSESLQADELFGHEKDSFTGAAKARKGKFLAGDGGTVFLDEIADLSPALQLSLLRTIDNGEIQPVGRDMPVKVDVRVITATNKDLKRLVSEGKVRHDLYDRLNVIELVVPSLRERPEDIGLLAKYFIQRECREVCRDKAIDQDYVCRSCADGEIVGCAAEEFWQSLQRYNWPGNVRELENLIIHLSTMTPEILGAKHLPDYVLRSSSVAGEPLARDLTLQGVVKQHIEDVLALTGNNQAKTARILGLPRSTLQSKIRKLKIESTPPPKKGAQRQ